MFIARPVANRGMFIICGTTPYSRPISTTRKPKRGRGCLRNSRLSRRYREKFNAAGYEFGASILNVMRCPACPEDAKPDAAIAAFKAYIVEILGDDEDGIAATMEDFGL